MNTNDRHQDSLSDTDSDLLDVAELLLDVRETVRTGASVSPQILRIVLQHTAALLRAYADQNTQPETRQHLDHQATLLRATLTGLPRTCG